MNLAKLPELNDNQIKLLTLINVRWVAIFGQFLTISIVYFYFNFNFNIKYCYLLVLFSSFLNFFLQIRSKKTDLLSNKQATFSILYDLFQLFGLLFLTGGLTNPFSILIVAPITIAAGFLNLRSSILIGFLSIALTIILSFFYFELPGLENNYLFPKFYILGLTLALCTTIIFLAIYSQKLAMENAQRNEAFNVLQQIFLREQELKSLGGLAAAAAHELGTPLNTISLVAKELKKEIGSNTKFNQDLDLLISQSKRCSEILKQISKNPYTEKEDKFLDKASFKIIVHEIIDSFKDQSKKKIIINEDDYKKDYLITKKIEIIYSLKNIIDNALKFSSNKIEIFLLSNEDELRIKVEDDGEGFSKQILRFLGDPYINKKDIENNKDGLGLGIFIAKVFLERLSAIINFYNLEDKGAAVDISWQKKDLINLKLI
ncbi:MAG: ActS/PrrB/RegB family redox-sensitive histidine kinase [Pseudomonadota bacterium]|jgi:two-component system sensor histidine kinase RegB|nr:ActS/PrrB/RegB family redox-sensitive histidine kinase [Alphaproteobacteria bacterium]